MNTIHLQQRMQQRGVPPLIVQWLEDFGKEGYNHEGCIVLSFDKNAKRRLEQAVGREPVRRMSEWLKAYLVISIDGVRITTGIRYRRIKN